MRRRPNGTSNQNISRRLSTVGRDDSDLSIQAEEESSEHLDNIINSVAMEWKELVDENSNTLEVALSLMDNSSIGKARYIDRFNSLKTDLQEMLKLIVNNNYQGFNTSIGSYRSVVHSVSTTQNNINEIKELLTKAKTDLATRRPVLRDLRETSLRYKQMISILEDIEKLNAVPDKLEHQISQKLFMSAHATLSEAIRIASQATLEQIPALQGMKSYLASQELSLYVVLVEELHNHVYLKSPYTGSRWHPYRHGIDDAGTYEQVLEDKIRFDLSEESSSFSETSQLDKFLEDFAKNEPFTELQDENAESNSFYYIRLLIETLGRLNKLPAAFEAISQRLPAELHKLIDHTLTEVSQRFPKNLNIQSSKSPYALYEVGLYAGDNRLAALKDLTWTLYSKYIAVLQAHRVIYEVSKKLATTQEKSGIPPYDFAEIFQVIESEIKSFLTSYIVDKPANSSARSNNNNNTPIQTHIMTDTKNVFTLEKKPRDKNQVNFKFTNLDSDQQAIKKQYQELQKTFEKTVPGLVATARDSNKKNKTFDPFLPVDLKVTHILLVSPNVFNIRVMLDPTVQFFLKSCALFPREVPMPLYGFVQEFLVKVFVPQLEKTMISVYQKSIISSSVSTSEQQSSNGSDIVTVNSKSLSRELSNSLSEYSLHWTSLSKLPILDGIVRFYEYIRRTCYLLNTSSVYRDHYVSLILKAIDHFTKSCSAHFESKVTYQYTTDDNRLISKTKIGAVWATNPKLRALLMNQNYDDIAPSNNTPGMSPKIGTNTSSKEAAANGIMEGGAPITYHQEFQFYLSKRESQKTRHVDPINKQDLLTFAVFKNLAALATSLRWLTLHLKRMKRLSQETDMSDEEYKKMLTTPGALPRDPETNGNGDILLEDEQQRLLRASLIVRRRWLLSELLKPVEEAIFNSGDATDVSSLYDGSLMNSSTANLGTGGSILREVGTRDSAVPPSPTVESSSKVAGKDSVDGIALTLAGDSIKQFDDLMEQLEKLADTCVLTLKADLRCRAIYYIDCTMLQGNYFLKADTEDRDVFIGKLDSDITMLDAVCVEEMVPSDRNQLLAGLARFLDELLIAGADGLEAINDFGIKKMYRNIVVLQQMLKSIAESPQYVNFTRSLGFYRMIEMTPLAVLEQAKNYKNFNQHKRTPSAGNGSTSSGSAGSSSSNRASTSVSANTIGMFSHDEIKTILRLIRSKMIKKYELAGKKDMVITERNAYHEDLVKLHDYFWGSEKVQV